jgi:uncharacterized phage protein (TIGR01671 family)
MRTIKFRAWDKERKEMIQPHDGDFIKWHAPSNWKDCYELMQYTGLKDKNGKEIYEGDIVSARLASNTAGFTGYVHYLNAQYWVNYIGYESYYQSLIYLHGAEYEPIEVIGNIYENPELIEVSG